MSKIEVDAIDKQSGSTLTLGGSGTAVTLASGATQSGFGRTGTVDWDTTIKTGDFTATNGNGFFVNTTSGAITVTLPASPSAGNIVAVSDYAQTAETNNITIGRNGSNIEGNASDLVIQNNGLAMTFVYADATKGWKVVSAGTETDRLPEPAFLTATGGTITTSGDFKIHTFTGPGTFCVSSLANPSGGPNTVDYLVVAGGGGGGGYFYGGGGGAGGFRLSNDTCMPAPLTSPLANPTGLTVTATAFPITVGGAGSGAGGSKDTPGTSGGNSIFSTITSTGGGGGGGGHTCAPKPSPQFANTGGSGGGGGGNGGTGSGNGSAAGNTPPVSPPQGNNGGFGNIPVQAPQGGGGGGGGGVSAVGGSSTLGEPQAGNCGVAGTGGAGSYVVSAGFAGCNGTTGPVPGARYFAGGGGGGDNSVGGPTGVGGVGGGGKGGPTAATGTTNTGGGGGGASHPGNPPADAVAGGSGIVIIRYKFQ